MADVPHKHGLAAGDVPARADWVIEQNWAHYTQEEHARWRFLFERQNQLLHRFACREFIDGLDKLPIDAHQIPNFEEVNRVLQASTGWQIVAVAGLVPDAVFFEHLANRRFPAGQFLRTAEQLDYLEEPDIFHDVFGHVPMLMNPAIADFIQAYGKGGLRALELGFLPQLARLYWYTIEFGLVAQDGQLRVYGAGIASSYAETQYALTSPLPQRIKLDMLRVMRTHYKIDDFQQVYFVLPNLAQLLQFVEVDFVPLYAQLRNLPELMPNDTAQGDVHF
ncbi:MAG: phenylalanine 4-monooxygenase [Formosimonas sp.]